MGLSWKTRRRLSLLILILGLPAYVVVAVTIVAQFERPTIWVELAVYAILGVIWALPLKAVFRGIGKPDPDAEGRDG